MKKLGFMCIVIAGLLWGTSGIFVHYLSPYGLSPLQLSAVRGTVSAVVIGIYLLLSDRSLFKVSLKDIPLLIGAGLGMYLAAASYYFSMQLTSISTSVVLMYTAPVFVMCYSVIFMGEKLTKAKLISLIAMILGCALVSGVIGGLKYDALGIILGLISGIGYAAYLVITKIEMIRKINPMSATFYTYVFMMVFATIFAFPQKQIIDVAVNNSIYVILLMIGLGVMTACLPYCLCAIGLKHLPAGTASSLSVVEPLAATLYSIILFKEPMGVDNIIGFLLIIGAVIMIGSTEKSN